MRISNVTIKNFRSIENVSLELDSYGTFIGANGTGKSSVLYALDWFFNGTALSDVDVHGCNEVGAVEPGATIEVSVTFQDLNRKDKERLQQYGRGSTAQIRRTWYADTKQTKTVGNAKQGTGFADVRSDQAIASRRQGYRTLRETHTDLPDLPGNSSKDTILDALSEWESAESHQQLLVDVPDSDATQMMGWHGTNVLRECVRFVLIPAATSIAGEVGTASRGTALTELVGAFMAAASARAQAAWLTKHASAVDELASDIRLSIEGATGVQANRINSRLSSLIPNASVELTPNVPDFIPKLDPSISTAVTIAGVTNDVSRQGHGVQRAVMISMFQAMVPDEDLMRQTHEPQTDEDDAAAADRLQDALANLPSIIVAVEEPEIYQHPVRARAFARTLLELSEQPHVQVLLATHSPFFVQPAQFSALHRFTYKDGKTLVFNTTTQDVATASGLDPEKIESAILKYVPTEFSEGFFADAVVLVEGQTDRIVIEAVATLLGNDLDRLGITVLSVEGKGGLQTTLSILTNLGIPTYAMADGDFGTASRKAGKSDADKANAHASHRRQTEDLIRALPASATASHGSLPASFGGGSVVSDKFAIWADDLEEELGSWNSFGSALAASGIDLAARNNKNQLAYRNAVFDASKEDLPESLASLVAQIVKMSSYSMSTDQSASVSAIDEGTS